MAVCAPEVITGSFLVATSMRQASEITLLQSASNLSQLRQKMFQWRDVDPDRIIAFLKDQHPQKTDISVEAMTGIRASTVRTLFTRRSKPSCDHVLRMIAAYGPEFLMAVMDRPPTWVDAAAQLRRREALEAEIAALEEQLANTRAGRGAE